MAFGRSGMDFYELRHFWATHLLELGVSHADVESLLGEQEFYPSCETRVAAVRVWFGRDPIRSITLLSENDLRQ